MIEVKIIKDENGDEVVIVPIEFNIGKLYRTNTNETDLLMTFGTRVLKKTMKDSILSWAKRNYSMYDLEDVYEEMYGKELTEKQKDNLTLALDLIEAYEYNNKKERNEAIMVQLETYELMCLYERLGIELTPIRIDETGRVIGFEDEVNIVE